MEDELDQYSPVYLNLELDQFKPDLMERGPDGIYRILRMVPPGGHRYYFTVPEGKPILAGDQRLSMSVPQTNIIDNVKQTRQLFTQTYMEDMTVVPRPLPKFPPTKDFVKPPWDFKNSIFANYQVDTPALLNSCFEFDWDCSKIPKFVKDRDELLKIKKFLK